MASAPAPAPAIDNGKRYKIAITPFVCVSEWIGVYVYASKSIFLLMLTHTHTVYAHTHISDHEQMFRFN